MGNRFPIMAAAACCTFAASAGMLPGEPAPDIMVRDTRRALP